MSRPRSWLVVILLVTGALITFLAEKLPGEGGHTPLHGFGIDIGPREIVSVIIAALGSLSFGAVLGPEAPLMAIGTALGALAFRDPSKPIRQVMMIVGAMAAIGAIFGNPLVTCVLMLEFAMLAGARMATPLVLMPALAGMAASYVLQVGRRAVVRPGRGTARGAGPGALPRGPVRRPRGVGPPGDPRGSRGHGCPTRGASRGRAGCALATGHHGGWRRRGGAGCDRRRRHHRRWTRTGALLRAVGDAGLPGPHLPRDRPGRARSASSSGTPRRWAVVSAAARSSRPWPSA